MRRVAQVAAFPLTLAIEWCLVLLSPLLVAVAGAASLAVDRSFRVPRAVLMFDAYVGAEIVVLAMCARIWIQRLRRRDKRAATLDAYALVTRLLDRLYRIAGALLEVHATVDGEAAAVEELTAGEGPVIVLSRHAGPGDSLLIAHRLLCMGRELRIVLRAALRFAPAIGMLATLLPLCFVRRGHGRADATLQRITALAAEMNADGALLLFPEGGNVSRERIRRSLASLVREGMSGRAHQAARLHHLAAPFAGGTLAALSGARTADVVFLAHTGLAGMDAPPWQRIPVHTVLRMHMFQVPRNQVPPDDSGRSEWLFDWWQRMDAWIDDAV